ncbi:MAG TPA: WD40 repeat domain-containing protein, partial [Candidatus Angelobacter sp.]
MAKVEPAKSTTHVIQNPYAGPTPYQYDDGRLLAGRNWEGQQLVAQTITDGSVLFYAQSGAGKSSLINKKVIPEFQRQGFRVMRVGHIGRQFTARVSPNKANNVFVLSLLLNWEPQPDVNALYKMSLVDYINEKALTDEQFYVPSVESSYFSEFHKPLGKILIIDQFEEIVTAYDRFWEQRRDFFLQLKDALSSDPTLSLIFVSREDSLAQLERYLHLLPNGLKGRFHMNPLTLEQAIQAIQEPATKSRISFEPKVAERLAKDLQRGEEFIDPVQLQAVCVQLWDQVFRNRAKSITNEHLRKYGNVDEALQNLYRNALEKVAAKVSVSLKTKIDQATIALWFDEKLIDATRRRTQVAGGLSQLAIDCLVDEYLVRPVNFGGETTYQLSHDRLIGPVLKVNSEIIPKNLPLREPAMKWDKSGRDESFLLRGHNLNEMEGWAAKRSNQLRDVEKDFLAASRKAELQRGKLKQRLIIWITTGALLCMAIFIFILWRQYVRITQQNSHLSAAQTAIKATYAVDKDPSLSLLLAMQAASTSYSPHDGLFPEVKNSLNLAIQNSRLNLLISGLFQEPPRAVFSPDGKRIAAGSGESLILLDSLTGEREDQFPVPNSRIRAISFSPDSQSIAVGYQSGAQIIDLRTKTAVVFPQHAAISSVAFSPDGGKMAMAGFGPSIRIWDWRHGTSAVRTIAQVEQVEEDEERPNVTSLVYSQDGLYFASGDDKGIIQIWDAKSWQRLMRFVQAKGQAVAVNDVAFCPVGHCIVTVGDDATAKVWNINPTTSPDSPLLTLPHAGRVDSVSVSPDGKSIVTGSENGKIIVWYVAGRIRGAAATSSADDIARKTRFTAGQRGVVASTASLLSFHEPLTLSGHTGNVQSVAFSPFGNRILSAADDLTVRVWNVGSIFDAPARDLALSPDGQLMAAATWDGLRVRTVDSSEELYQLPISQINHVAFSPDSKYLGVATEKGILLLDSVSGSVRSRSDYGCEKPCDHNLALGPGRLVVFGSNGVTVWQGDMSESLPVPDGQYFSGAFDSHGTLLALGSTDQVVIWDNNRKVTTKVLHCSGCGRILTLAFNPTNDDELALGSESGKVKVWNIREDRILQTADSQKAIFTLAFNPDGKKLAIAGAEATVKVINLEPEHPGSVTLIGHKDEIHTIAFGPRGTLVSGGYDQLVLVHHLDSTDLLQAGWERLRRPFNPKECQEYLQMRDCPPDYEVFIQGLKFAQIGKIDQAVAKFQELKRNPAFVSTPADLAAHFRADYLLDRGNLRVRAGEIKEGMSDFEEVKKTDPARLKFALPELFRYARLMLNRGQVEPLIEIAKHGPEFDDSFSLSADVWNDLCWYGSLWGNAQNVMFACDRAVELSGGNAEYRDSKGV